MNTCLESPSYPHTLGAAHYRHSVVVGGVSSEPLRERDSSHSTLGGGGVPVDQVGVGWVCTIVNGAGVPWLIECALHKHSGWISGVNIYSKNTCATCERTIIHIKSVIKIEFQIAKLTDAPWYSRVASSHYIPGSQRHRHTFTTE